MTEDLLDPNDEYESPTPIRHYEISLTQTFKDQQLELTNDDKCDKCPVEDHSGYNNVFCRCEGRNIRIAKERRNINEIKYSYIKKIISNISYRNLTALEIIDIFSKFIYFMEEGRYENQYFSFIYRPSDLREPYPKIMGDGPNVFEFRWERKRYFNQEFIEE